MGELVWTNPAALAALALPALLLLVVRVLARPEPRATGTLHLWRRAAPDAADASAAVRPRIPLATWLLAASLAFGALALAGPRVVHPTAGRLWRAVVDRRPGMFLPVDPAARGGAGAGETRLDAALAAATRAMEEAWRPGDRVRWTSPGRAPLDEDRPGPPPVAWLAADRTPAPRPDFEGADVPGAVWVTGRAEGLGPRGGAGLFASGGAAVPGLVGRRGGERLLWRGGDELEAVPAEPRAVRLAGSPGPSVVGVVRAWAGARGLALAGAPADVALVVAGPAAPPDGEAARVGRDGWALSVRPAGLASVVEPAERAAEGAEERIGRAWQVWLEHQGEPLVRAAPGRVEVAFGSDERPDGDPAAFAVSFGRLFDGAALPEPGAVSLAERRAAGPAVARPGDPPREAGTGPRPPEPLDAWLAAAAALAALAAASALASSARGARAARDVRGTPPAGQATAGPLSASSSSST